MTRTNKRREIFLPHSDFEKEGGGQTIRIDF